MRTIRIDLAPLLSSYGKKRSYLFFKIRTKILNNLDSKFFIYDSSGFLNNKEIPYVLALIGIEYFLARRLVS